MVYYTILFDLYKSQGIFSSLFLSSFMDGILGASHILSFFDNVLHAGRSICSHLPVLLRRTAVCISFYHIVAVFNSLC